MCCKKKKERKKAELTNYRQNMLIYFVKVNNREIWIG